MSAKRVQSMEGIGSALSHRVFVTVAYLLLFVPHAAGWLGKEILPNEAWIRGLGVIVTAAGIAFAIWARVYLGGNWSSSVTVKVGHQLVRTGPYRWVRHPIYTGLILASLGTALALDEWRGFVAVPLLYIGFTIKSKIEERTMANTFGTQYEEYSRGTGGIIPKLL
jgi:protein-S-isoprenylcysteine O-methyltransferase Ste14